MTDLTPEEEQVVDGLAFHLLKEAYCDLAAVLLSVREEAARALFYGVDRRIADALARIHANSAEGPRTTPIVLAVGSKIGDVLDQAHGRMDLPEPQADAYSGAAVEPRA